VDDSQTQGNLEADPEECRDHIQGTNKSDRLSVKLLMYDGSAENLGKRQRASGKEENAR